MKCETCGEEIVFDLEGVNVFGPGDLEDLCIKPLFGEFGRERVLRTLDEITEKRGYKKVRFLKSARNVAQKQRLSFIPNQCE